MKTFRSNKTIQRGSFWLRAAVVTGSLLLASIPSWATWSIVAAEPRTGELGAAVATCTPWASSVVAVVPGKGVIVTQAASNRTARERGELLIARDESAADIVAAISDPEFDPTHAQQQHGVVGLHSDDSAAGYTGGSALSFAGDVQRDHVSIQGNILAGQTVLAATLDAFLRARHISGTPLAEQLLTALEAGAEMGGDRRCGSQTAISAYLVVVRPGDPLESPALRIVSPIQYRGGESAVRELRRQYDAMAHDSGTGVCHSPKGAAADAVKLWLLSLAVRPRR